MTRKLASIRRVDSITPIEGADFIQLVRIGGWQCVIKKGELAAGDLCVYFEIDSFLPIRERYEFLRKSSYRRGEGGIEGFRLRSAKFRKALSQGLAMPLSQFQEIVCPWLGQDVTELLQVKQWEPPLPVNLAGEALGLLPGIIKKTDEERIQNLPDFFDRMKGVAFECTEKIDGASMTVYLNQGQFGVCSRSLNLRETPNNTLWRTARRLKLEELLWGLVAGYTSVQCGSGLARGDPAPHGYGLALQGELAGEGIQKNPLQLKGQHYFLYSIWVIDTQQYLSPWERLEISKQFESVLQHVPVIHPFLQVFQECPTMEELLAFAEGYSMLNKKVHREGLVFKSCEAIGNEVISFKAISNKYLLKHER